MFKSLLDSMLQCICELWDTADSEEKKNLLIQGLEGLVTRFKLLRGMPAQAASEVSAAPTELPISSLVSPARELLSIIVSATGLLERHEQQLTPERRAEEFSKIRTSIQRFALLLDEVTI